MTSQHREASISPSLGNGPLAGRYLFEGAHSPSARGPVPTACQERLHHLVEALRLLEKRAVAAVLEHLEAGIADVLVHVWGTGNGEELIVATPADQGGHVDGREDVAVVLNRLVEENRAERAGGQLR